MIRLAAPETVRVAMAEIAKDLEQQRTLHRRTLRGLSRDQYPCALGVGVSA